MIYSSTLLYSVDGPHLPQDACYTTCIEWLRMGVCELCSKRPLCVYRYITQEGHKLEVQPRPPMAVTNAVSWRSEGIKYRKNEVFLDIIESVNLLVSGTTRSWQISYISVLF